MAPGSHKSVGSFALAVCVSLAIACGEIAGLHDPDVAAEVAAGDGGLANPESNDDVAIEPQDIDIGTVACGTTSADVKNIVIRNRGTTTPKYSVQIAEGSGFELQGAPEGDLGKDATVTIGVVAKPTVSGELTGEIVVDPAELSDAKWFRADDLPTIPPPVSIARRLIDAWVTSVR